MITTIIWLLAVSLPDEDTPINRLLYVVSAILATIVVNR